MEMIEIAPALGLSMSTKDKSALSSVRRAAAVTLKVLKHGRSPTTVRESPRVDVRPSC